MKTIIVILHNWKGSIKPTLQRSLIAALVLISAGFATPGMVVAGPPLVTEDTETVGKGNVEVEFNYERLQDRNRHLSGRHYIRLLRRKTRGQIREP
jgi:hypothetical protein